MTYYMSNFYIWKFLDGLGTGEIPKMFVSQNFFESNRGRFAGFFLTHVSKKNGQVLNFAHAQYIYFITSYWLRKKNNEEKYPAFHG